MPDFQPRLFPQPRLMQWGRIMPDGPPALNPQRWIEAAPTGLKSLLVDMLARNGSGSETSGDGIGIEYVLGPSAGRPEQGYKLEFAPDRIRILAGGEAGAAYACSTLIDVLRACSQEQVLPTGIIEDEPVLETRGLLLDISRNRIPTMARLRELIDLMFRLRFNQLQLYMEHTFAHDGHSIVHEGWDPVTAEQVRTLDALCRSRQIDLVPCQQSFGHMEKWLCHEPYRKLGIKPEGGACLDPRLAGTRGLLNSIYRTLLPNFSSGWCNVCCDEVMELEEIKVFRDDPEARLMAYAGHLQFLGNLLESQGKSMMFWGDMLVPFDAARRAQAPPPESAAPRGALPLVWGYQPSDPLQPMAQRWTEAGFDVMICPGTSAWTSFIGRDQRMRGNLEAACQAAVRHNARGMILTDWTIHGLEHPAIARPAYVLAAARFWNPAASPGNDLPGDLAHVMNRGSASFHARLIELTRLNLKHLDETVHVPPHFAVLVDPTLRVFGEALAGLPVESIHSFHRALLEMHEEIGGFDPAAAPADTVRALANDIALADLATRCLLHALAERPRTASPFTRQRVMDDFEDLWLADSRPGGLHQTRAALNHAFDHLLKP